MTPNPPAALSGAVTARLRDAPMLATWQVRGWLHGATRGPVRGRVVSAVCAVVGVPTWPLLVILVAVQAAASRSGLYLSPERDAVLGVAATRTGWRIENHCTKQPGTGAGSRLRDRICPELLRTADRHGVTVYLDAVTPDIGSTYMQELPGLEDVGPARLRGRRMHRVPRPAYS